MLDGLLAHVMFVLLGACVLYRGGVQLGVYLRGFGMGGTIDANTIDANTIVFTSALVRRVASFSPAWFGRR